MAEAERDTREASKLLRLRRGDRCATCGLDQPRGTQAWWDSAARVVRCRPCVEGAELARALAGEAGASARKEFERRHANRQDDLQRRFGRLAPIANALSAEPQSTAAWAKGASGEVRLSAFLAKELGDTAIVLHDRRVPGSRANIDHLVVSPSGIWVVDAKSYSGKVEFVAEGSVFRPTMRLRVGGRDRSELVDAVRAQVEVCRRALGGSDASLPVHGVLCFVDSDWSLFAKPFVFRGVLVAYPGGLVKRIRREGPLDAETVSWTAARLATALPPSTG